MPSLQSATMIGHGKKDPRPQLNEKYRQDCLMIAARTNCHQHVKKDLQMLTKYPETIQKLEGLGIILFHEIPFDSSFVFRRHKE
jgi:hypothetical protein